MRYFIIPFNSPNLGQIQNVIFGDIEDQRKSLDGTMFVASLPEGDTNNYECLDGITEYDESGIIEFLKGDNWTINTTF